MQYCANKLKVDFVVVILSLLIRGTISAALSAWSLNPELLPHREAINMLPIDDIWLRPKDVLTARTDVERRGG